MLRPVPAESKSTLMGAYLMGLARKDIFLVVSDSYFDEEPRRGTNHER